MQNLAVRLGLLSGVTRCVRLHTQLPPVTLRGASVSRPQTAFKPFLSSQIRNVTSSLIAQPAGCRAGEPSTQPAVRTGPRDGASGGNAFAPAAHSTLRIEFAFYYYYCFTIKTNSYALSKTKHICFLKNHRNVLTDFKGKASERFIEINYLGLDIYSSLFFQLLFNVLETFHLKYI